MNQLKRMRLEEEAEWYLLITGKGPERASDTRMNRFDPVTNRGISSLTSSKSTVIFLKCSNINFCIFQCPRNLAIDSPPMIFFADTVRFIDWLDSKSSGPFTIKWPFGVNEKGEKSDEIHRTDEFIFVWNISIMFVDTLWSTPCSSVTSPLPTTVPRGASSDTVIWRYRLIVYDRDYDM